MAEEIYLDPTLNVDGSVVKIGSACYRRVGPSDRTADTFNIDDAYDDCDTCQADSTGPQSVCDFSEDSTGGDEGFDQEYDISALFDENHPEQRNVCCVYNTYSQKDQIVVSSPGQGTLLDTGCVGTITDQKATFALTPDDSPLRVRVIPNCEGGSGTAWTFSMTCGGCCAECDCATETKCDHCHCETALKFALTLDGLQLLGDVVTLSDGSQVQKAAGALPTICLQKNDTCDWVGTTENAAILQIVPDNGSDPAVPDQTLHATLERTTGQWAARCWLTIGDDEVNLFSGTLASDDDETDCCAGTSIENTYTDFNGIEQFGRVGFANFSPCDDSCEDGNGGNPSASASPSPSASASPSGSPNPSPSASPSGSGSPSDSPSASDSPSTGSPGGGGPGSGTSGGPSDDGGHGWYHLDPCVQGDPTNFYISKPWRDAQPAFNTISYMGKCFTIGGFVEPGTLPENAFTVSTLTHTSCNDCPHCVVATDSICNNEPHYYSTKSKIVGAYVECRQESYYVDYDGNRGTSSYYWLRTNGGVPYDLPFYGEGSGTLAWLLSDNYKNFEISYDRGASWQFEYGTDSSFYCNTASLQVVLHQSSCRDKDPGAGWTVGLFSPCTDGQLIYEFFTDDPESMRDILWCGPQGNGLTRTYQDIDEEETDNDGNPTGRISYYVTVVQFIFAGSLENPACDCSGDSSGSSNSSSESANP